MSPDGTRWIDIRHSWALPRRRVPLVLLALSVKVSMSSDQLNERLLAGSVRVADGGDGSVSRIDPRTNWVIAAIAIGHRSRVAVAGGSAPGHRPAQETLSRGQPRRRVGCRSDDRGRPGAAYG